MYARNAAFGGLAESTSANGARRGGVAACAAHGELHRGASSNTRATVVMLSLGMESPWVAIGWSTAAALCGELAHMFDGLSQRRIGAIPQVSDGLTPTAGDPLIVLRFSDLGSKHQDADKLRRFRCLTDETGSNGRQGPQVVIESFDHGCRVAQREQQQRLVIDRERCEIARPKISAQLREPVEPRSDGGGIPAHERPLH